jgi:hypothetical protein
MNNTLIGDNAVSSYIGFAITSGCEILLRSDIVIRNDKASAQLFTCAKVKAPGAQKPECTKVHEDFEI